ncbi:MAG: TIR domain-containing protein [Geminicoccaceae bacterium]
MPNANVLFICTGNTARSQMAEGLLRSKSGSNLEAYSAGSHPEPKVHPLAIRAMEEIGVDISSHRPKSFKDLPVRDFDYIVSVCDMDVRGCPYYPAQKRNCHWELIDPVPLANFIRNEDGGLRFFRSTRNVISNIIDDIIKYNKSQQSLGRSKTHREFWTTQHVGMMLNDFRDVTDISDPILAGIEMFKIAGEARRHAKDPNRGRRVFIVHGRDTGARDSLSLFLERVGAQPKVIQDEIAPGRTIIEKLEMHSDVSYAIVLITDDDVGGLAHDRQGNMKPRARENVILELGYFAGKLGRDKVCIVKKGAANLPSDFHGVEYISMDDHGAWKDKIKRHLIHANIISNENH